jgi:hypothetical protein
MIRITADNEVWEVAVVLQDMLDPELEAQVDAQIADFEALPDDEVGSIIEWEPSNWTGLNCAGGSNDDVHVWEAESRTARTSNFTAREKSAVRMGADRSALPREPFGWASR